MPFPRPLPYPICSGLGVCSPVSPRTQNPPLNHASGGIVPATHYPEQLRGISDCPDLCTMWVVLHPPVAHPSSSPAPTSSPISPSDSFCQDHLEMPALLQGFWLVSESFPLCHQLSHHSKTSKRKKLFTSKSETNTHTHTHPFSQIHLSVEKISTTVLNEYSPSSGISHHC